MFMEKLKSGLIIAIVAVLGLALAIGFGVNYFVSHCGSINYQCKTSLFHYNVYALVENSTLNGYIKADGNVSVYILTTEDFKRMKDGEPFKYYKAWEHVKTIRFTDLKIPKGDYVLVVKNDEKGWMWMSAELIDRRV